MRRILILWNSWSGKTTLAKRLSEIHCVPHLDLDTVAWDPDATVPTRLSLDRSTELIRESLDMASGWIAEWSYASLAEILIEEADELYFLDVTTGSCVERATTRAYEPHKFASKEAQDAALAFLLDWIRSYDTRSDEYGRAAHAEVYGRFHGTRHRVHAL